MIFRLMKNITVFVIKFTTSLLLKKYNLTLITWNIKANSTETFRDTCECLWWKKYSNHHWRWKASGRPDSREEEKQAVIKDNFSQDNHSMSILGSHRIYRNINSRPKHLQQNPNEPLL